jgi:predicted aspartyl protease
MEIGDPTASRFVRLEALVDTGATYTWGPRSVLLGLGHSPDEEWDFELADGRLLQYGIRWMTVRLDGRAYPTPVVFGDDGTEPLLGVVTLEEFRLGVDAVNQRLIPTPALLKSVMSHDE